MRSYSALNFDCGFMDGDDDENIFNSTTVSVLLQDGENIVVHYLSHFCHRSVTSCAACHCHLTVYT